MLYWCFTFWLTSLCIIGSSFIHLFRTDSSVYMYRSFLIHSSADGHLGCFHVLAIIDSAAMNTGVHVNTGFNSWRIFTLPRHFYQRSREKTLFQLVGVNRRRVSRDSHDEYRALLGLSHFTGSEEFSTDHLSVAGI